MITIIIIKMTLMLFISSLIMLGIAGVIICYRLAKKLNPTIRIIIYSGFTILFLVTLAMNLSFKGIHILIFYLVGFIFIGLCGMPKVFIENWINKEE